MMRILSVVLGAIAAFAYSTEICSADKISHTVVSAYFDTQTSHDKLTGRSLIDSRAVNCPAATCTLSLTFQAELCRIGDNSYGMTILSLMVDGVEVRKSPYIEASNGNGCIDTELLHNLSVENGDHIISVRGFAPPGHGHNIAPSRLKTWSISYLVATP